MPTAIITAVELLIGFARSNLRPPTPERDPLRLVRVLRSCGFPLTPELEQTAVLHGMLDGIEDLDKLQRALAAIQRVCGEKVASMVRSLAKDPAHKAYPAHLAEQRYLARLSCHAMRHPEILLVKLAEASVSENLPNSDFLFYYRSNSLVQYPESKIYSKILVTMTKHNCLKR